MGNAFYAEQSNFPPEIPFLSSIIAAWERGTFAEC
jgi:hypothetical protein